MTNQWYKSGEKSGEWNYKDGKQNGLVTQWYKSGKKSGEWNYKDGELDGLTTNWDEDGQKKVESTYKNGELDGLTTNWYEDGRKKSEETFLKGELVGKRKKWTSDGKFLEERLIYFQNGEISERRSDDGENISYYSNRKIQWNGNYRNGKRHGVFKYYDYYGDPTYIEKYDNGKLIYKK